jgi:hypothetical protein
MGIRPQGDTFLSSGSLKMSVKHRRDSSRDSAGGSRSPTPYTSAVSPSPRHAHRLSARLTRK